MIIRHSLKLLEQLSEIEQLIKKIEGLMLVNAEEDRQLSESEPLSPINKNAN